MGKILIAVDEDIDPEDLNAVVWAMSFRMQPLTMSPSCRASCPGSTRRHRSSTHRRRPRLLLGSADRRDAQAFLSADVAAGPRVHGERVEHLARAGAA